MNSCEIAWQGSLLTSNREIKRLLIFFFLLHSPRLQIAHKLRLMPDFLINPLRIPYFCGELTHFQLMRLHKPEKLLDE